MTEATSPAACWADGCEVQVTRDVCPIHRRMLPDWLRDAIDNHRQRDYPRAGVWVRLRVRFGCAVRERRPTAAIWRELWAEFEREGSATMEEWLAGEPDKREQARILDELARDAVAS
jgi:hypothetical protein